MATHGLSLGAFPTLCANLSQLPLVGEPFERPDHGGGGGGCTTVELPHRSQDIISGEGAFKSIDCGPGENVKLAVRTGRRAREWPQVPWRAASCGCLGRLALRYAAGHDKPTTPSVGDAVEAFVTLLAKDS
jgi:hypothetical protein